MKENETLKLVTPSGETFEIQMMKESIKVTSLTVFSSGLSISPAASNVIYIASTVS